MDNLDVLTYLRDESLQPVLPGHRSKKQVLCYKPFFSNNLPFLLELNYNPLEALNEVFSAGDLYSSTCFHMFTQIFVRLCTCVSTKWAILSYYAANGTQIIGAVLYE